MSMGEFERGDFLWVRGPSNCFQCIHKGKLVASISSYEEGSTFQVLIHQPKTAILLDRWFSNLEHAMSRAEEIVGDKGRIHKAIAELSAALA